MATKKYMALIECAKGENSYAKTSTPGHHGFQLKTAFLFEESASTYLHKRFPGVEVTTDYQTIFGDDSIELVVVSAPSAIHQPMIGAALQAKKQVQII